MLIGRHIGQSMVVAIALAAAAACGSPSTATTSPTPVVSAPVAQAPAVNPSAVPTTLDPCQLVTSQEASSLAGVTYGAGAAQSYPAGSKGCVYGSQTLNVFSVLVAQAADAGTADAAWAQEESQAQSLLGRATGLGSSINVSLNDVSNLAGADRAAVGAGTFTVSGRTFGISVIYVIKGANFFTFSDLVAGHAGPSTGAMESQAQTVLGRLP